MSDYKDKKPIVNLPENVPINYEFDRMLKFFMKQVDKNGILQEIRARRYYIKPSAIKRMLENERRRKNGTTKNMKRRKNR